MKIEKKSYLLIRFKLSSPMLISNGIDNQTDNDLLLNSSGRPYIPATTIAGVLREMLQERGIDTVHYFGFVKIANELDPSSWQKESRLVFRDGILLHDDFKISIRHSVALDQYKTSKDGAKFDMEILEAGSEFETVIEQNLTGDDKDVLDRIAHVWRDETLRFGAKSTRGFGKIQVIEIIRKDFNFKDQEQVRSWLLFDVSDEKCWKNNGEGSVNCENSAEQQNEMVLRLKLKLKSGLSIRTYTTDIVPKSNNSNGPDFKQMTAYDPNNEIHAVIPGSTWAGAFRSRIMSLTPKEYQDTCKNCFGYVREEKEGRNKGRKPTADKKKSLIVFDESFVYGGVDKDLSRNAIDRFSGGTIDGALFTESSHYYGTCDLNITFRKPENSNYPQHFLNAFAAAITDLHYGYLSIGGETSIGRGVFEIETINGEKVQADNYEQVLNALNDINEAVQR